MKKKTAFFKFCQFKMPAGRKSGKGSGARPKSTVKTLRKPSSGSSGIKISHGGTLQEERCKQTTPDPPLLPASLQPDNELDLEGAIDDGKLSELSAEEPDSSECEYLAINFTAKSYILCHCERKNRQKKSSHAV